MQNGPRSTFEEIASLEVSLNELLQKAQGQEQLASVEALRQQVSVELGQVAATARLEMDRLLQVFSKPDEPASEPVKVEKGTQNLDRVLCLASKVISLLELEDLDVVGSVVRVRDALRELRTSKAVFYSAEKGAYLQHLAEHEQAAIPFEQHAELSGEQIRAFLAQITDAVREYLEEQNTRLSGGGRRKHVEQWKHLPDVLNFLLTRNGQFFSFTELQEITKVAKQSMLTTIQLINDALDAKGKDLQCQIECVGTGRPKRAGIFRMHVRPEMNQQ